jgi:outer membrane protein OmpU
VEILLFSPNFSVTVSEKRLNLPWVERKSHFIATTALVATASVAAADITLSGMGRIGVVSTETAGAAAVDATTTDGFSYFDVSAAAVVAVADGSAAVTLDDGDFVVSGTNGTAAVAATNKTTATTVDTRVQFDIAGSGEAQNGMTFGGKIRLRGTSGSTTVNGAQVMLGYGDLTVYGGNIPGVLESMPHAYANTVGYSGGTFRATVNQADTMAYTSTGAGANALQANFSMGSVSVAVAHQPSNDNNQASVVYSANGLTVALGGQFSNRAAEDETVASIGYAMGNYSFNVSSSDNNGNRKTSFGGAVNAGNGLSLNAYVTENESEADNAYGFGVKYDLGGATFGEPPPLNWSTTMFRKRRTRNGKQATEARRDRYKVTPS